MDEARQRLATVIGGNIRARRVALGLSQYDVADKLLTRQAVISEWERGRWLPHIDSVYFLAKTLECTIFDLLEGI